MEDDLLQQAEMVADEAQVAVERLLALARKNEELLLELKETSLKINYLETKVQAYHANADMLGIGLTALALVLAVLAIIFMWNVAVTAKSEAIKAAKAELTTYLSDVNNTKAVIESWLDNNRTSMASEIWLAAVRNSDDLGDDYGSAWDEDDLSDVPGNEDNS